MCKKAVIPERKYKLHRPENCFRHGSNQESIKEGIGGNFYNKDKAVKYFHNSKNKWKGKLEDTNKQNKMIYCVVKRYS